MLQIRSKKLVFLLLASLLLAICVLCYEVFEVRAFAHEIVNIFAGGRSSIKIYLFLAYTALLLLLNINLGQKSVLKFKINYKFIIYWVAGIFAYNMVLFFVFIHKYGFKLTDFVVTVNNSEISSTKLIHNHVTKGAMGLLLNLTRSGQQENLDAGFAFVGLIPALYLWLALICLFATLAVFVVYYKQHFAAEKTRSILVSLLYSIVTFSLMKNFIDGGIFNRETLIAIFGLLLLILPAAKRKFAAIPLVAYAVLIIVSSQAGLSAIEETKYDLLMAVIFVSFIAALWYWWKHTTRTSFGIWLAALSIVWLFVPSYNFVNSYSIIHKPIVDGAYLGLYQNSPELGQPTETIGHLNIYDLGQQFNNQEAVLNKYHLLDNIQPIKSKWATCFPNSRKERLTFDLIPSVPTQLHTTNYQFGNLTKFTEEKGRYKVTMLLDSCAPRPLNIVQEILDAQVSQPYFMVNLKGSHDEYN